ncbi:hypothetical protein H5410_021323 [Solanum commersonii]|uniref:DUF4283 domain-containing protein n=1 Tax=Solanum commersonii TaxID=4109 RepID=A0A9J5ZBM4_SOLCO|nr:hypothetical protein H5410_021323 [Solanum commersonii]
MGRGAEGLRLVRLRSRASYEEHHHILMLQGSRNGQSMQGLTIPGAGGSNPLIKELDNEHFLSKCLVGRCDDPFHHSPKLKVIQKWFVSRWQVTIGLKLTPINHNLFLFYLPSIQEVDRVKVGIWFWNDRKFVDINKDTKHRTHFYWARICIRKTTNKLLAKIDIAKGD